MAKKVLWNKGWGPCREVTPDMMDAHAKKYPNQGTARRGAWLLRGTSGVTTAWRGGHDTALALPGYSECCPVNSRCEPVDIEVEVQRTKTEIRRALATAWALNEHIDVALALLNEYASAPE